MSRAAEFGGRPFAAGVVRGLRTFRLAPFAGETVLGCMCQFCMMAGQPTGLYAATNGYQWQPGENVADCRPQGIHAFTINRDEHRAATKDCLCGFYAYYNDRNDYTQMQVPTLTGIIEGYGLVTVGSLGFRAEKARIVALVAPGPLPPELSAFDGVPLFPTTAEALAAFPTTRPEDVGVDPEPQEYALGGIVGVGRMVWVPTNATTATLNIRVAEAMRRAGVAFQDAATNVAAIMDDDDEADTQPVVERVRSIAEQRAEQRRAAGLRNTGGFDRRGRRR